MPVTDVIDGIADRLAKGERAHGRGLASGASFPLWSIPTTSVPERFGINVLVHEGAVLIESIAMSGI